MAGQTVVAHSRAGNDVGDTPVSEIVHSAGYAYTQYGMVSKHQKVKG